MYIWEVFTLYPNETIIGCVLLLIGWFVWTELSKFWYKPLYITAAGKWRVYRYAGRLMKIGETKNEKRLFRRETDENIIKCRIKIRNQPIRDIMLNNKDIMSLEPRKIVMNKKFLYWDINKNAFNLTDDKPQAYLINPQNLERFFSHRIDTIDIKSNKSARASPVVVHSSVLQQHLPIDFDDYDETEPRLDTAGRYVFDYKEVGQYGSYDDLMEEKQKKKDERRIKPNVRGPGMGG